AALGASRGRLVRQVLAESTIIALVGGAFGLLLAQAMIAVVAQVTFGAGVLAPSSSLDPRVAGFTALAALLVGLLFGLWPALRAARLDVPGALRGASLSLARRRRQILVGAEIAPGVTLLAGTGLLVRSMARMLDENPGFDAAHVLTFQLWLAGDRYAHGEHVDEAVAELRHRVEALPGVIAAGAG